MIPSMPTIFTGRNRKSLIQSRNDQFSPAEPARGLPQENVIDSPHSRVAASGVQSLVTTVNGPSHQSAEARDLIQKELENNNDMNNDRQNVLRSTLDFVSGFSHLPNASQSYYDYSDLEEDFVSRATPPELLYMMLPGMARLTYSNAFL